MVENSKIEWTDHTFNPWIGCTKVSAACDNCYAETWDKRFNGERWGAHAARTRTSAANWRKPLAWDRQAAAEGVRRRVFCASLADVFDNHKSIDPEWRADLWELIQETQNLDWLLLTKRPQNIKKFLPDEWDGGVWGWPWSNVWLGTTVENQEEADRRIPHLLSVPAVVHFVSCEPLLGQLDLTPWLWGREKPCGGCPKDVDCECGFKPRREFSDETSLDWVICGGESGRNARPMHPDWARSLRDQCRDAGVAFFMKQWGEWASNIGAIDWWEIDDDPEISRFDHVEWEDGKWSEPFRPMWCDEPDESTVSRIGKKRAGRLLDGIEHNGLPEVAR